jgi:hypothetical protein
MTRDENTSPPVVTTPAASPRESLVQDARSGLTPAQMVERKLAALLHSTPMPVSRMQNSEKRRALS